VVEPMITGSDSLHRNRKSILEQVKRIIFHQLTGKSARIYLFGSWARSEEKRSSDIDVAIEFDKNEDLNHRTLMNIRHALEESTIPYKIDVVHLNGADDFIVKKVREEGILWDAQSSE
jgi:predicted nucleotidyltransferase